jgi:hypothetical protein
MKQAKAQRKKVEIVDESQLDGLRCATTAAGSLRHAQTLGKKVDIIE